MTRRPWIDATHGKLEGEQEPILFLLLDDFRDFSPLHAAAMPISRGKMMPSIIVAESGRWWMVVGCWSVSVPRLMLRQT